MGTTLRELIELAGGMSRGKRAEVLDAGRLVDAAAHRRAPRRAARLRRRWPRPDRCSAPSAMQIFDEDDCVVLRVLQVDGVLRARVVRQVHAVPRGQLLDGQILRPDPRRRGHRTRTWTPCSTPATTSSAASFCALGDGATSPVTSSIQYFREDYLDYIDGRTPAPTAVDRSSWERTDMTDVATARHRDDWSPSRSTAFEVSVPKGALLIRAAEQLGIEIPRFCDHPLLDPAGACRQCLVEVTDMGNGRGMPKPVASCTTTGRRRHGRQDPAHLAGGRQGAAGRHGAAADQPPARLPDLRQGRRVPAAEPGDVQRPRRLPVPRRQADVPEADRDLDPGAARPRALRALPALHPVLRADRRRPVHRPARARRPASRSATRRDDGAVPAPTSPATPCRSARSAR